VVVKSNALNGYIYPAIKYILLACAGLVQDATPQIRMPNVNQGTAYLRELYSSLEASLDATKSPLISVIMPVYNRQYSVSAAIESVLTQTFPDFELIVVDDGSTDASPEIITSYLGDHRLHYQRQKNSGRPSLARNTGLQLARADWVAFLDSDDQWIPDKLFRQVALLEKCQQVNLQVDLIIGDYEVHVGNEVKYPSFFTAFNVDKRLQGATSHEFSEGRVFARKPFLKALYGLGFVATQAALVSRKLLNESGGFDSELIFAEDNDLWLTIAEQGTVGCVNGITYRYFHHDNNITSSKSEQYFTDTIRVLERHQQTAKKLGLTTSPIRERSANYYLALCRLHFANHRWSQGCAALCKSLPGLTSWRNWRQLSRSMATVTRLFSRRR
jgi:glycosyltransferase involved in cell wall biosynthesis